MGDMPIYGVVGLTILWFFIGFALGALCGNTASWVDIRRLQRENTDLRTALDTVERKTSAFLKALDVD